MGKAIFLFDRKCYLYTLTFVYFTFFFPFTLEVVILVTGAVISIFI